MPTLYATEGQMIDLFGEDELILMTDGDGAINQGALTAAMNAAQAEIDGYLAGIVALPLSSVPSALALHACNIAYWYLDVDNPTDGATTRYRAAVRFLERVQDGKAGLGLAADDTAVPTQGGVAVQAPPRVFSDERLRRYTG
ncbi:MAG: DUF1320 domain-containing protein [Bacteroidota bacterium]